MTFRQLFTRSVGLAIVMAVPSWLIAQEIAKPTAQSTDHRDASTRDTRVLAQTVALHLDRVPLREAFAILGQAAHLRIMYSPDEVPLEKRVSLTADKISVGDALHVLLQDTGLEIGTTTSGWITVRPPRDPGSRSNTVSQSGTATISGYVRDSATGASIPQVAIRVDGTALETKSGADGRYKMTGIAAGEYRVTARRVGYLAQTRSVTLMDGETKTLTFLLNPPATKLDEVVTTALGEQRRYQIGNDISTINADSIAPTAPITSVTDLISARAPGVTVLETSGLTGAGEAIRIEGLTSLVMQNDPIIIVDGVREDNSEGGDLASFNIGYAGHPTPTRLNDIDFSDIETIDILKGPSAATEYGTDAANGVIVITTKHGTAGAPQWKASAEQAESDIPGSFPNGVYSWGHLMNGTNTAVNCPLFPIFGAPASEAGDCVVDSLTQWNPLNHAVTSIFTTGDRGRYGLSVSGGSETMRYFVSGGLSNETGVIQMPPVFRELADTAALGLPSAAFNPNSEQQRSVRANTAIVLGHTADLSVTASYLSTDQQTPNAQYLYLGVFGSPALSSPANYYGYGSFDGTQSNSTPLSQLTEIGSQNTDRVTGGITTNWRPTGWFVGHATVGLDHGSQINEEINYPLANAVYENYSPSLGLADITTDVYSVDLRATATASLTRDLRSVTSGGLQMADTKLAGQTAYTSPITTTNLTLNGATAPSVTQAGTQLVTLGGYGEEELSVADRLFVTGALRVDAGSGFGSAYSIAEYPKASISWLALNDGPTTVRVRGAFGESGVQPMDGAALQLYTPGTAAIGSDGSPVSVSQISWPGNPNLQPERSVEFEGGVDVGGWRNRVSLELTGYSKLTHDALVNVQLGEDLGDYTYQENIGEVKNRGVNATLTVGAVQTRTVTWNVAVNASENHNVLVSLAPGVAAQTVSGYDAEYRQEPGYPLYGYWALPVTYVDANHDGIIEPNEVSVGDSDAYAGSSLPTQEVSVSTHLGLWKGIVTVGGLVDYRGGYKMANDVACGSDAAGNTPQANDPQAPLWLQARAVINSEGLFPASDVENGSFVRVREVSVTYAAPRSLIKALRVQNLSITAAVRNLVLWTRYTGGDPEVSDGGGYDFQSVANSGGGVFNNDMRENNGAVPLARYWMVRLNLGI